MRSSTQTLQRKPAKRQAEYAQSLTRLLVTVISWLLLVVIPIRGGSATDVPADSFRVLSWNISGNPLERDPKAFAALLRRADPDILLLDEVSPNLDLDRLRLLLLRLDKNSRATWHVSVGSSGGRQRVVIASHWKFQSLPLFSGEIPYPEKEEDAIARAMSAQDRANLEWRMDVGIPANAALIDTGRGLLLVAGFDFQCCGNDPSSWQETRRRLEAREIRQRLRETVESHPVDGIVIGGDLNIVTTTMPLIILAGPYGENHHYLSPAEVYQLDGESAWTWDGRGTEFASCPLDFQLFGSQALELVSGFVLDSQDLTEEELETFGLDPDDAHHLSDHRPLLVEYSWRKR